VPALDLITLDEFKAYAPVTGSGSDARLRSLISVYSRAIEAELGRRIRYRAPAELAGAANIVAAVAIANGAQVLAAQPDSLGRTLIITIYDPNHSISAGTVTVTGTLDGVAGATEVVTIIEMDRTTDGWVHYSTKVVTALTSVAVAALAGNVAADTLSVGTSLGYVEYHTRRPSEPCDLWAMEWPLISVIEVNEDSNRVFGAGTRLVAGTDYVATSHNGRVARLSSALRWSWSPGWRAVKKETVAGFTRAGVPAELKDACCQAVTMGHDQAVANRVGVRSVSDATGNWTRFSGYQLTPEIREQIAHLRRRRYGAETGERDWDLEAA
jgi:hypothetical protein